jgi:hypothetical protein
MVNRVSLTMIIHWFFFNKLYIILYHFIFSSKLYKIFFLFHFYFHDIHVFYVIILFFLHKTSSNNIKEHYLTYWYSENSEKHAVGHYQCNTLCHSVFCSISLKLILHGNSHEFQRTNNVRPFP